MRRGRVLSGLAVLSLMVSAPLGRAAAPAGVPQAIDRGVAYLKALQQEDGTWPHPQIGATALAGLTLLECDVPANDPSVQKAAAAVRQVSVAENKTYSLALSILFLDRLGDPDDIPLIESMTVRLLAGQNSNGGWTYSCPDISEAEVRRLTTLLRQRNELKAGGELPKPASGKRTVRDLAPEIQAQLKQINAQGPGGVGLRDHGDDNSNTQFATLALWVARRHGLPTDAALAWLDARFRASQNPDGGWGYKFPVGSPGGRRPVVRSSSTATMTCAGLLGLAVARGSAGEAALHTPAGKAPAGRQPALPDPLKDLVVRGGLIALGTAVERPEAVARGRHPGRGAGPNAHGGRLYYFLWSMERVAVAYGLDTIGNKDWYAWGATVLLATQEADGSWQGEFAQGGPDTCFALLFLRRANLARDLSAVLKGKVQDPGEAVLHAGGFGGDSLPGQTAKLPLADQPDETPPSNERPAAKPAPPVPHSDGGTDAARLSDDLVHAGGARQQQLLGTLQESKGPVYTEALAQAIPRLNGDVKTKAREALAERLTRMTSKTLADKLRDDSPEIRRAAALAVAMKEDRAHIPQLIEMLADSDRTVERAAHAALKSLAERDLGPAADADRGERARAVAAWKAWWRQQGEQ